LTIPIGLLSSGREPIDSRYGLWDLP
jgi:hypothetical protein